MSLTTAGIIFSLPLIMLIYFRLARRFQIIDVPNGRSSHQVSTIRGGGILFPLAIVLWFISSGLHYPFFILGLFLLAYVSFLDDLKSLSTRVRLIVQFIAMLMLIYAAGYQSNWLWFLPFLVVAGIAWLNIFNFMDGVNGITGFYSLVTVGSYWYLNQQFLLIKDELFIVLTASILVFLFFNARKRAKTFAGDIGSITMAYALIFFATVFIYHTGHWSFLFLFSIYVIDSISTIVQRLYGRENIFRAHRKHLYQLLANEMAWPHLRVSATYAFLQLLFNLLVIYLLQIDSDYSLLILSSVFLTLTISYIIVKRKLLKSMANDQKP
jgi:UDP-N-acetylmuramyl pentapeptide phosphotransferase/UDP-N-acetylglucosamine-1-phosphate transferase